jgi:hypothetical protein
VVDLTSGLTMIVSDLHGDQDAFARHVGRFLQYKSRGKADRLVILGDLIHSERAESEDSSLSMLLDVMRMRETLGADAVIHLCGNHELVHIYSIPMMKGRIEYTPRFERAMTTSGKRDQIIAYLKTLPFYVRTAAGVSFTHAGPHGDAMMQFEAVSDVDHQEILDVFNAQLKTVPNLPALRDQYARAHNSLSYDLLTRYQLSVSGADDPRYDDLLRGFLVLQQSSVFNAVYDALFTRCEKEMPMPLYERILKGFLDRLSVGAPAPQSVLVTGHIDVIGGHAVITPQHLRIASGKHAHPREHGQYLLLDVGKPIQNAQQLVELTGCVY